MRKSQISTEFLFAIGVIFFIFLMILGFMFNRSMELRESEKEIDEINTCLLISTLITSAFVAGDGVIINETIEYELNITGSSYYKELDVVNSSSFCLLAIRDISNGRLQKGVIEIENQNNKIEVDNV